MKTYFLSNVERDITFEFSFQDSDGFIELVFDEEQECSYNGWDIGPHVYPSMVCTLVYMILITYNVLQISIDRFCTILYVY